MEPPAPRVKRPQDDGIAGVQHPEQVASVLDMVLEIAVVVVQSFGG